MLKLGAKKPKQERSKGTVEAIITAVTHIMDKEGPIGLTTNKIAEVAGVSVGSLYQYFKNKESIFETILLRMTEDNLNKLEKKLDEAGKIAPEDIVRQIVESHFESIEKMGKLSSVLFQYAPQVLSPAYFKKADERIVNYLLKTMEKAQIEIRPKNKEQAFFVCNQALRAVIFMAFLNGKVEERPMIRDELIDMLTVYLRPGQN